MPFAKEAASALGSEDVMKDPEVRALFTECRYHDDPISYTTELLAHVVDVSDQVYRPEAGYVIAADGSSYESSVTDRFPSAHMGLVKLGQVWIDIARYRAIDPRSGGIPDPIEIARIEREKATYSIPLTGAGIHLGSQGPRTSFRDSVFRAFRSERFRLQGATLAKTLVDLCEIAGMTTVSAGRRCVLMEGTKQCPVTGEKLGHDVAIPEDEGHAPSPREPRERIYLTDVLRLSEAFAEEGSNRQAYTRAMNILEHMLLAHALLRLDDEEHTRQVLQNAVFLMDGPLAIFGEPAPFHRPIMQMVYDLRRRVGGTPPIIMGVTKSGRVVDHGKLIHPILRERFGRGKTLILPITDAYRYRYIDLGAKSSTSNFGNDTYYGQSFLVRSAGDRMFELTVAYPFREKGSGFQDRKVELSAYGSDIGRALGVLDLFETELYEDANVVQHLAHRCASIAHRPAGRTLDAFVRSIIAPKGRTAA